MNWNPFRKNMRFSNLLPTWKTNQDAKFNDWSTENAIQHGLKASTYVYACIRLIARSISSVPWYVYQQKANGDWQQLKAHPLELLLEKPTPFHSRKDLMEGLVQHLYLGGNAVFTKVKAGQIVTELWQLPPDALKVIPSRNDFIDRYEYNKDGIRQNFKPAELIHWKFNDPANPYWGLSPLQAGAKVIDSDIEAVKFNKVSLQNRAIADGIFTFDHPITRDQWEEARKMIREQHQGADNAHTPWVLGAGAKWQQMSLSPAEMDFLNSRRFSREEICSIFNVPPPMVGIMDTSTYNNIETARKIFWQDAIIPLLEDIKNTLNQALTPEFGDKITLDYDVSNIEALQTSIKEKLDAAKSLFSMGVPFNTINQRLDLGFDPVDGGDVGYLPSGLMPANYMDEMAQLEEPPPANNNPQQQEEEEEDAEDTDEPTDEDEDQEEGKSLFRKKNALQGRIKGLNLRTAAQKEYYFQQVERKRSQWVLNMTRKAARLFTQEGEKIVTAIKNGNDWEKAIDENKAAWESFLFASYQTIVEEIGTQTFEDLVKSYKPWQKKKLKAAEFEFLDDWEDEFFDEEEEEQEEEVEEPSPAANFDPHDEIIKRYIMEIAGSKVTGMSDWSRQIVGAIVMEAHENNDTVDQLAVNLRKEFKEFSRYRAYRIARTETQNALGFAQYAAGRKAGEALGTEIYGEWVTSLDDRVRDSHQKLHGEKAKLGEPFSNGLKYAGEYTNATDSKDNINCRCVIIHHFD